MALARTPLPTSQVIAVVASVADLGASTTATGVARTLATIRDDYVALLSIATGRVDAGTIQQVSQDHAVTVVDLGAHVGEATAQTLAVSTHVVVVAGAGRAAAAAAQLTLERLHEVHPTLVAGAMIAVVCRNRRQHRRVSRTLLQDRSPQSDQIVPIPYDPALPASDPLDLAALQRPTREAYLRLAAALVGWRTPARPPAGLPDTIMAPYTASLTP